MIPTIDGPAQQFLADLQRNQAEAELATREISSGLKVERPSDGPDAVREILSLGAELAHNTQVQTNLSQAKDEVDAAEGVLQTSVKGLENAITLGAQGAGSQVTAADRQTLAIQVQAIEEQLVSSSAATVNGRYIFSGDRDNAAQYQLDLTAPNGVQQLFTAQATRQIEDSSGIYFGIAKTAQEIFDNPGSSVFAAIDSLRVALQSNSDAGIQTALASLHQADDYLNTQLSYYGATQDRIDNAIDLSKKFELQRKTELSDIQDADLSASIVDLTQRKTQLDAAMEARAKLPTTSLFDFLG